MPVIEEQVLHNWYQIAALHMDLIWSYVWYCWWLEYGRR